MLKMVLQDMKRVTVEDFHGLVSGQQPTPVNVKSPLQKTSGGGLRPPELAG